MTQPASRPDWAFQESMLKALNVPMELWDNTSAIDIHCDWKTLPTVKLTFEMLGALSIKQYSIVELEPADTVTITKGKIDE